MKTRRKYTREFKVEAVRMANEPGVTLKQIGAELGVNPHLLGKWRKQMQEDGEILAFPGQGKPRDEEMAALKRELTRVKKERDFLKKRWRSSRKNRSEVPHDRALPRRFSGSYDVPASQCLVEWFLCLVRPAVE